MANPNPIPKFQKGHKKVEGSGRKPGSVNLITRDIRQLIREAAAGRDPQCGLVKPLQFRWAPCPCCEPFDEGGGARSRAEKRSRTDGAGRSPGDCIGGC